ncbi:hypothetical protein CMV_026172 [Castanea mollissima]|uniref:Uncharacterized protein n=1 Tax=Castanea mollissima TaxID=60419 RepID=A0A8J4Q891_9ROSI|nr:hypothetical protein CMV_026172 [Castanea mollissima]
MASSTSGTSRPASSPVTSSVTPKTSSPSLYQSTTIRSSRLPVTARPSSGTPSENASSLSLTLRCTRTRSPELGTRVQTCPLGFLPPSQFRDTRDRSLHRLKILLITVWNKPIQKREDDRETLRYIGYISQIIVIEALH